MGEESTQGCATGQSSQKGSQGLNLEKQQRETVPKVARNKRRGGGKQEENMRGENIMKKGQSPSNHLKDDLSRAKTKVSFL